MESLFELLFYIGVIITLVGLFWLAKSLMKGQFRSALPAVGAMLLGIALVVGPAIISRNMAVDLGPREKIVSNERHITLTGWDETNYSFLSNKSDTVILQMGNADVSDATLDFVSGMSELRDLDLNDSGITDVGLKTLARLPKLRTLRLRGTKITDQGFRDSLLEVTSLKQLDLRQTDVSAETIAEWKSADETRKAFQ